MAKGWFVIHAYSGHENKVKKQIDLLRETHKDAIFEVKVPSEEVVEIKDGKRRVTSRKFLPGYVLVEMDLPDRGGRRSAATSARWRESRASWHFTDAAAGAHLGRRGEAILQKAGEIKADRTLKPKLSFAQGESVRIIDGPFNSFTGNIEDVNLEKGKLKVMVGSSDAPPPWSSTSSRSRRYRDEQDRGPKARGNDRGPKGAAGGSRPCGP